METTKLGLELHDKIRDLLERTEMIIPKVFPKQSHKIKEGGWSISQVLNHMADATMMSTVRIQYVLAEANPTLTAWDQDRWANLSYYLDSNLTTIVTFPLINANLRKLGSVARRLSTDQLERIGTHTESGEVTVQQLYEATINHLNSHLDQLEQFL